MFSSPIYYIVLSIILLALIVLLVRMIIQRRKEDKIFREYMEKMDELRKLKKEVEANSKNQYRTYREKQKAERRAPANPQRETYYTTYNEREDEYIPKYAAGDDMDKINRHPVMPERRIPDYILYAATAIALVFLLISGKPIFTPTPTTNPSIQAPIVNQQSQLKINIINQTMSEDGKKLIIDAEYKNNGNSTCYNIRTEYSLLGEDGQALQTADAAPILSIAAYETIKKTHTITLKVDPALIKQTYGYIHYITK